MGAVGLRADVVGATNPAKAGPASLRGKMMAGWQALGCENCNKTCIHHTPTTRPTFINTTKELDSNFFWLEVIRLNAPSNRYTHDLEVMWRPLETETDVTTYIRHGASVYGFPRLQGTLFVKGGKVAG